MPMQYADSYILRPIIPLYYGLLVIIHTLIHTHNHVHSMYMCESEYVHENRQKYFVSSSAQNTSQMPTLQYGRLVFPEHA